MDKSSLSKLTLSVHAGSIGDSRFKGIATPIFPASAYDYEDTDVTRYPRYFNTPNQKAAAEKLAALENAEAGMIFSSGLAAILTAILAMVRAGDHVILQSDLYGGTHDAIAKELPRFGIMYTFVDASSPDNFRKAIRKETKVIYVETPSNPTLKITDLKAVAAIARENQAISIVDNTFASPVNQNPLDLGIDIVAHSGTKYIGGHSDLCCGAVLTSTTLMNRVAESAIHFGGTLDAHACWLVERSLKTIVLRVRQQNENAMAIARYLKGHPQVSKVYYPGLEDHPGHEIAREQMKGGFGGMLSFETRGDASKFLERLKLIQRAISLGGVESTIALPVKSSHAKMSPADRASIGVTDNLVRLSVGIEASNDLIADLQQALG